MIQQFVNWNASDTWGMARPLTLPGMNQGWNDETDSPLKTRHNFLIPAGRLGMFLWHVLRDFSFRAVMWEPVA